MAQIIHVLSAVNLRVIKCNHIDTRFMFHFYQEKFLLVKYDFTYSKLRILSTHI